MCAGNALNLAALEREHSSHDKDVFHRLNAQVKSNFELHLIDSHEVSGSGTAFYDILLNGIDREAR